MIHGVIVPQDQLRCRHDGVALLDQAFDNGRQRLRRVLCRVVEQHNGSRLHTLEHALGNVRCGKIFPVQTVYVPLDGIHPAGADGGNHTIIIVPIGRAEQIGLDTGDGGDFFVARLQLALHLLG